MLPTTVLVVRSYLIFITYLKILLLLVAQLNPFYKNGSEKNTIYIFAFQQSFIKLGLITPYKYYVIIQIYPKVITTIMINAQECMEIMQNLKHMKMH